MGAFSLWWFAVARPSQPLFRDVDDQGDVFLPNIARSFHTNPHINIPIDHKPKMPPPTNIELNNAREEFCLSVTPERKYFRYGDTWVKRSLRPSEWQKHGGYMFVPKFSTERVLNEGACLQFLLDNTEIPLPRLYACFEDAGAAYLVTEFVDGVAMSRLDPEQQKLVVPELEQHVAALKDLTSRDWGGPTGLVLPPYRIMRKSKGHPWHMRPRDDESLVFCHNDLSASNIIVDPYTLKIKAIVDWEYAGFYPPEFDCPFYLRPGPPVALPGEFDDVDELCRIIDGERVYLENAQQQAVPLTPGGQGQFVAQGGPPPPPPPLQGQQQQYAGQGQQYALPRPSHVSNGSAYSQQGIQAPMGQQAAFHGQTGQMRTMGSYAQ